MTADERIRELGYGLPNVAEAKSHYAAAKRSGKLLYISGQPPFGRNGKIPDHFIGKVGRKVTAADGSNAARLCLLHIQAHAKAAFGPLEVIRECVRLGGLVNAESDYVTLAEEMNGASDVVVAILGERGRHARTTVGVAAPPLGSCAEVEALLEINTP